MNEATPSFGTFTDAERAAVFAWWRETAFPSLDQELGNLKWGAADHEWSLILQDQGTGFEIWVMKSASRPGERNFYVEPNDENLQKLRVMLRAVRKWHAAARG